jgi:hypothetical protein
MYYYRIQHQLTVPIRRVSSSRLRKAERSRDPPELLIRTSITVRVTLLLQLLLASSICRDTNCNNTSRSSQWRLLGGISRINTPCFCCDCSACFHDYKVLKLELLTTELVSHPDSFHTRSQRAVSRCMDQCPLRCISSGSCFRPEKYDQCSGIYCRWVRCSSLESELECHCIRNSPLIRFCSVDGSRTFVSLLELANLTGFIYTSHILFECDAHIRSVHLWESGVVVQGCSALQPAVRDAVVRCQPCARLSVQYINDTIGYGLFADDVLPADCVVCEYTGVVRTRPSFSDYAVRPATHRFFLRDYIIFELQLFLLMRVAAGCVPWA